MPGLQSVSQPVISKQQIGSQLGCVYQLKKNWFSLPQSEGKRCLTTRAKISALPKLPANGQFWLLGSPDTDSGSAALTLPCFWQPITIVHPHHPSHQQGPSSPFLSTSHIFCRTNYALTSLPRGTGLSENESKPLWIGNRQAGSLGPDNWV